MKTIYKDASVLSREKRKEAALQAMVGEVAKVLEYSGCLMTSMTGSVREPEEYENAYQRIQEANDHLQQALEELD